MASTSTTDSKSDSGSRIPNFFRLSVDERIRALHERELLSDDDIALLRNGDHTLRLPVADKMIENVVGIFGLPLGLGLNFLINGRDYIVPLVVEEPSIVAGLSGAARMARLSGGYTATSTDPILIGQVQAVGIDDPAAAIERLLSRKQEIIDLANSMHPKMVARGGGALDVEAFSYVAPEDGRNMVVLHLLVDTRDAMGANLVNTMCEGVATLVETISGGKVFLRILSNLTDRAMVRASVSIPVQNLAGKGYTGEDVRDGIVLANDLALVDPYRAATHNKGIMNGVDAVALATGNDWRAIEAAAHAYAARSGRYKGLTSWRVGDNGDLVGEIEIPMKVGTVGGSLESNRSVLINHRLMGSPGATELAEVMGTIGLAQNFAALRALSTDGIQQNHMTLHARSVASTAGAPDAIFEAVVEGLIEAGDIKVWKAKEIIKSLSRPARASDKASRASACGKVILLGEHAVVYERSAIAVPIPLAVEASVRGGGEGISVLIPRWGVEQRVRPDQQSGIGGMFADVFRTLGIEREAFSIDVTANIPRAMGLGGSAALAVAVIRALDTHFSLGLNDSRVNELAFVCEQAAHGRASGIDNTVATFGTALRYRAGDFSNLVCPQPLPLVIGITGDASLTAETVAQVRRGWQRRPERFESMFDGIEKLTQSAVDAIAGNNLEDLGELMNHCHGYLNALQLSTPRLESLIAIARSNGAVGAKLTGGGGGGSMVALCPDDPERVVAAMRNAGFEALSLNG